MEEPTEKTIPCPPSLTASAPKLPPATSQALIAHLRANTNAIPELSNLLSDSLNRTGWTDRVKALALELLRNGKCDTFPELMAEVMRRAKTPKEESGSGSATSANSTDKTKEVNGTATTATTAAGTGDASTAGALSGGANNGNNAIALSKEWSGGPDGLPDVRVPLATVELAIEFLQEQIAEVIEPVRDDDDESD
ncbi:hypothetical protein G647_07410 [Cladophialophora carrionii CBS 160.54]|uniref:Uncharacterized protein n=1 Tax=Cladophialophora carrionii CBS 160.54 TaxID=1279043 RepID=V9D343_9EURO|nr:uncharacterized protein G647_07410 [Cladophialophora carrionii CBS 160.54]ETI21066.1 hypothetical protein G647_07410 [Cladophialophora carrionii CBS 160.54]